MAKGAPRGYLSVKQVTSTSQGFRALRDLRPPWNHLGPSTRDQYIKSRFHAELYKEGASRKRGPLKVKLKQQVSKVPISRAIS